MKIFLYLLVPVNVYFVLCINLFKLEKSYNPICSNIIFDGSHCCKILSFLYVHCSSNNFHETPAFDVYHIANFHFTVIGKSIELFYVNFICLPCRILFALCSRGYPRIYRGWCFYIDLPPQEAAVPNQWNTQIISISFLYIVVYPAKRSSRTPLRSNSSCPNGMYYSHRWTESNRDSWSTHVVPFLSTPVRLRKSGGCKKFSPFSTRARAAWKNFYRIEYAISRAYRMYTEDTYHKARK